MIHKSDNLLLPGFTAEYSIHKQTNYYRLITYVHIIDRHGLIPQLTGCMPPSVCDDPDVQGCRCRRVQGRMCCDPS